MIAWLKTGILMAAITALFGAIGGAIGGQSGMMMALGFAVVTNFFAYWFSDKMVLRMYKAQEVDESSAPQYYNMVRDLAGKGAHFEATYYAHQLAAVVEQVREV